MAEEAEDDGDDPRKYIIFKHDFRRLPRWPKDGIDLQRHKFIFGGDVDLSHRFPHPSPDQQAMTDLLGGWLSDEPLLPLTPDKPKDALFQRTYPFLIQRDAARETEDHEAARDHLLKAYRSNNREERERVRNLLEEIGCTSAIHKASRDKTRFPDMKDIISPLLKKNLGTDNNVKILFGEVEHVRKVLLLEGCDVAELPPPQECGYCKVQDKSFKLCTACKTTLYCSKECQVSDWKVHKPDCLASRGKPVSSQVRKSAKETLQEREKDTAYQARITKNQRKKVQAAPKECGYCETKKGTLSKCGACKSIHYCSEECKNKDWPVHRPDCLRTRGKTVPKEVEEKAEQTLQARQAERDKQAKKALEPLHNALKAFKNESPNLVRSSGHTGIHWNTRQRLHFPSEKFGVDILVLTVEELNLTVDDRFNLFGKYVDLYKEWLIQKKKTIRALLELCALRGVPTENWTGYGLLVINPVNKAKILVLYEPLFSDTQGEHGIGIGLMGIYVAEKVLHQEVWWKKVEEPRAAAMVDLNRYERFQAYLNDARKLSKPVPVDCDIGIFKHVLLDEYMALR